MLHLYDCVKISWKEGAAVASVIMDIPALKSDGSYSCKEAYDFLQQNQEKMSEPRANYEKFRMQYEEKLAWSGEEAARIKLE